MIILFTFLRRITLKKTDWPPFLLPIHSSPCFFDYNWIGSARLFATSASSLPKHSRLWRISLVDRHKCRLFDHPPNKSFLWMPPSSLIVVDFCCFEGWGCRVKVGAKLSGLGSCPRGPPIMTVVCLEVELELLLHHQLFHQSKPLHKNELYLVGKGMPRLWFELSFLFRRMMVVERDGLIQSKVSPGVRIQGMGTWHGIWLFPWAIQSGQG